jgi:small subunit ribosomal protein S15
VVTKERKKEVLNANKRHAKDTGSPEVQVSMLTERIQEITEHLKRQVKDHAARRGLLMLVGQRSRHLKYLSRQSPETYKALIERLGIRK